MCTSLARHLYNTLSKLDTIMGAIQPVLFNLERLNAVPYFVINERIIPKNEEKI